MQKPLDKLFSSTMVVVGCLPYPFQCGPAHLPSLLEFLGFAQTFPQAFHQALLLLSSSSKALVLQAPLS